MEGVLRIEDVLVEDLCVIRYWGGSFVQEQPVFVCTYVSAQKAVNRGSLSSLIMVGGGKFVYEMR